MLGSWGRGSFPSADELREGAAIGTLSGYTLSPCFAVELNVKAGSNAGFCVMQTALCSARAGEPRCPGSKDKASEAKHHYQAAGYGKVKRHGVDPAGGIGKVLANPEK